MAHRLSREAENELDDIWRYIATKSSSFDLADRLIDPITECFFLISRNPHIGRRRDHDLRPGLRTFPVGEYIIIYRTDGEDVIILHVIRGSRHIQALLQN